MPQLPDARQELFCQEIVKGRSGRDAYRAAGYTASNDNTAVSGGSRLLASAKIKARVAELLAGAANKAVLSRAWIIDKLVENVERAMQATPVFDKKGEPTGEYTYQGTVANRALELLGKERGMFVDRTEVGAPGDFDALQKQELLTYIAEEGASLLPDDVKARIAGQLALSADLGDDSVKH